MGRTYIANNKQYKGHFNKNVFDVNFSGADVLGLLMYATGDYSKKLEADNAKYGITDRLPSTRFSMDKEDCVRASQTILAMSPEKEKELYGDCLSYRLIDLDATDFHKFIVEWATFLQNCDGYKVN